MTLACEGSATPTLATRGGSFGRSSLPRKCRHRGRCRGFSWPLAGPGTHGFLRMTASEHLCPRWAIGAARAAQLNLVDGPYLAYQPQCVRLVAVLDETPLTLIRFVTFVVQPTLDGVYLGAVWCELLRRRSVHTEGGSPPEMASRAAQVVGFRPKCPQRLRRKVV